MSTTRRPHNKAQPVWRKYWSSYIEWTEHITWLKSISLSHRPWIISLSIILLFLIILIIWPQPQQFATTDDTANDFEINLINNHFPILEQESPEQSQINHNTNDEWQQFQLQPGQSIAQLFRDNNLPVNDAFALASAEGENQQLKNLPAGQIIKIKQAKNGTIIEVDISLSDQEQIYFVRQPDGTFIML